MAVKHVTLRAWSDNSDVAPVKINQGDILSRTIIMTLLDSTGAPIDLTLSSARVHFSKPDGTVVYLTASIVNAAAGIISVTLDSQCTAVPGLVKSIVQVTGPDGENMYCTGPKISVGAINIEGSIISSNEFTALTDALKQVQGISNEVGNLLNLIEEHKADTAPHFGTLGTPELTGKKIEVVAGVIRQNTTDRTKWDFLKEGHVPIGVSGDFAVASSKILTINYSKTYTRVISFIAGVDEYLANVYQCTAGASVGLSSADLQMSARINIDATILYNGTNWVYNNTSGSALVRGVSVTGSETGANITVNHDFCPGASINLIPFTNEGKVIPYIPVLKSVTDTSFVMNFVDYAGNFVSTPDTKMCFRFNKVYNGGIMLDGTGGFNHLPLNYGNIWFFGIFEV